MAKVSVELGLTLKLKSGGGFNMFKPSLAIQDINLDAEITPQIEAALAAIHEQMGNDVGAQAALEEGLARLPGNQAISSALNAFQSNR